MRRLLIRLWRLYFLAHFFLTLLIFYLPFRFLLPRPRFHYLAHRIQVQWARWLLLTAGIRWRIEGRENLPPQGGFVIVANHSSALDILLMYMIVPRPFHFMAKQEHARTPLFGVMFGHTHIPLDRKNPLKAAKALEKAKDDLRRGIPIVVFPEGTMNKNPQGLLPFKSGAFRLAADTEVPVVPVAFPDHPRLLPRIYEILYPHGGPGVSHVYIGKPLSPSPGNKEAWKSLSHEARAFIARKLDLPA